MVLAKKYSDIIDFLIIGFCVHITHKAWVISKLNTADRQYKKGPGPHPAALSGPLLIGDGGTYKGSSFDFNGFFIWTQNFQILQDHG